MNAIHLSEYVTEKGLILHNPELMKLKNKRVEIIIIDNSAEKTSKELTFKDFTKKWAGFLSSNADINLENRISYLEEKYK